MTTLTHDEAKLILSLLKLYDAVYDVGLSEEEAPELCKAHEEAGDHSYKLFDTLKAKAKLVIAEDNSVDGPTAAQADDILGKNHYSA